jgi:hypothetical protein
VAFAYFVVSSMPEEFCPRMARMDTNDDAASSIFLSRTVFQSSLYFLHVLGVLGGLEKRSTSGEEKKDLTQRRQDAKIGKAQPMEDFRQARGLSMTSGFY